MYICKFGIHPSPLLCIYRCMPRRYTACSPVLPPVVLPRVLSSSSLSQLNSSSASPVSSFLGIMAILLPLRDEADAPVWGVFGTDAETEEGRLVSGRAR